jgi:hypothetical protein
MFAGAAPPVRRRLSRSTILHSVVFVKRNGIQLWATSESRSRPVSTQLDLGSPGSGPAFASLVTYLERGDPSRQCLFSGLIAVER